MMETFNFQRIFSFYLEPEFGGQVQTGKDN